MGKRTGAGRDPDPISAKKAAELDIVSRVDGPIERLDFITRSLLFGEISMLAYLTHDEAEPVFNEMGFDDVRYIERSDAEVFLLRNDADLIVACRGTEPTEWNDIKADAKAWPDVLAAGVRIHSGFNQEVDDVWPDLVAELESEEGGRVVWFTGHSLGGAMATLAASRADEADFPATPREVVTFGSPRVGNKTYVDKHDVKHVRWVNNNDIVTRVPPTWLRYKHLGQRRYFDRNGDLRRMTPQQRSKDRWAGFRQGLKERKFDHFSDHAIARYVEYLRRAAEK